MHCLIYIRTYTILLHFDTCCLSDPDLPTHVILTFVFTVCTFNGIEFQEGDYIQPDCSTQCICHNGHFQCESQGCITDGATCYVSGFSHHQTFDIHHFDLQGDCDYVLTQSCNSSEFSVIVTNSAHNQYASHAEMVRVVVPNDNLDILLGSGDGGSVTVNGRLQPNSGDEVILQSGQVEVVRAGGHPHVTLRSSGIRVSWDGLYHVEVTVSSRWREKLCGICGNYNDDSFDDTLTLYSYNESSNVNNLDEELNCTTLTSPDSCPPGIVEEAERRCAVLKGEQFDACNNFVNVTRYYNRCVFDYCFSNDNNRELFYYNSLAAYARTCARSGIFLTKWRTSGM